MVKNTLRQQRKMYSEIFGDTCCLDEDIGTLQETDEAIETCNAMLQDSISRSDKEEISYWRKALQENKVDKRRLLTT